MGKGEIIAADIVVNGFVLSTYTGSVVNDDGLFGFIADHIAVFLYHIYNKAFDIEHSLNRDIEYFLCLEVGLTEEVTYVC